jgi:hypothetical protein
MMTVASNGGHSAQVKIQLLIDGCSIAVAQLGPDFLLLESPFDHPPDNARLVLQVDHNERNWAVRLPNGISAASNRVALSRIPSSKAADLAPVERLEDSPVLPESKVEIG